MPQHTNKPLLEKRLQKLTKNIPDNTICLIHSGQAPLRNQDITYHPFRVDSNFYYLNHLDIPNVYLLIQKTRRETTSQLFFNEPTKTQKKWEKHTSIQSENLNHLSNNHYQPTQVLCKQIKKLLKISKNIYHNLLPLNQTNQLILQQLDAKQKTPNLNKITGLIRLIKDKHEIQNIQVACKHSIEAHRHIKNICSDCQFEYQIEAEFEYHLKQQNIKQLAYPSIIAAGKNACILHYTNNESKLKKGDLLLIDAGCEYQYYASDITRTWPIGKATSEKKDLYEIVKYTQQKVLDTIIIGQPIITAQKTAIQFLTQGLIDLGILSGTLDEMIETKAYQTFYMHGIGHHLGLDVHDPCPYQNEHKQPICFQPGMVMTIEPGLYIPNKQSIPKYFRNTGVRIEDVIYFQQNSFENLSKHLTKNWD